MVRRVFYPPSIFAGVGRNSFRPHQGVVETARSQTTPDGYFSTTSVAERGSRTENNKGSSSSTA